MNKQRIGRACEVEIKQLEEGMDFRRREYRRQVFLDFYRFHLTHRSHPGGVYFAMPWLIKNKKMDMEKALWMAFVNGCSQNIITTYLILREFPHFDSSVGLLDKWWNANHHHFKAGSGWDSDRKYFKVGKTGFPACVESYQKLIGKQTQQEYFNSLCNSDDPYQNFRNCWDAIKGKVLGMGRLSTFSYLEYLRIVGLPLDCDNLFLDDMSGSKSHRNGLCKVLGRDDLDDHQSNPDFPGYTPAIIEWLTEEGAILLDEAKRQYPHLPDLSYFTLESTLCCYKSWHRPNRRYPNVYMDMMYDRIEYAEQEWGGETVSLFWDMRQECLPKHLRLEVNPNDPGLSKEKQNHYRLTGQPIMMSKMFSYYDNPFDRACWAQEEVQGLEGMMT